MTQRIELDLVLSAWFDAEAVTRAPAGLADSTIARVAATRRRPAWRIAERWLPVDLLQALTPPRRTVVVWLAIALMLALVGALLAGARRSVQIVSPAPRPGQVAFVGDDQVLYESDVDGSHRHPISAAEVAVLDPGSWSPRGDRIAFVQVARSAGKGRMDLVVANADGSNAGVIVRGLDWAAVQWPLRWSPDGRSIAYAYDPDSNSDTADLDVVDVGTGRVLTLTHDAIPDRTSHGLGGAFAWSQDSRSIAFVQGNTPDTFGIWGVAADGSTKPQRLTTNRGAMGGSGAFVDLAWSPAGPVLAFTAVAPSGNGGGRIDVVSATGGPERTLTSAPPTDREAHPVWSTSGDRIAYGRETVPFDYLSGALPEYEIVVIGSDGGGAIAVSAPGPVFAGEWAWAADDSVILAATAGGTFLLDPSNKLAPQQVPAYGAWQALR